MQASNLLGRVKGILLTPRSEWPLIAAESDTIGGIYTGYILILAAIPALRVLLTARFLGFSVLPIVLTTYVMSLVGTFIVALIVDGLAPTFGGEKSQVQALKVVAYSYTASWIASLIGIVPGLGVLAALVGLIYGLYLLYLGLPFTMKCPADKSLGYTIVTVIAAIVVTVVLGLVVRSIGGFGYLGGGSLGGMLGSRPADTPVFSDHSATADAVNDYAKRMDEASKKLDSAQKSGDAAAKANALGAFMGAAMGSGGKVESLAPDVIKTFLPQELGGLKRTQQAVERNGVIGMQISKATATYSDGANHTLELEIVDAGTLKGMVGFASGWAGVEQESQTDTGYDKTYKDGGQLVHEQWNNATKSGEYSTFVADRFSIKVSGAAADIGDLKRAAASINASGLAALKNSGVAPN
ncbi:MAG TPA: Yip1 family protein [Steroidobacteraceae bacterium]